MSSYRYFTQRDFDRCVPPCNIADMNPGTMRRFDFARQLAGTPFVINSAHRTVVYEKSKGRNGNSAHTTGQAMDIRATDSRSRWLIINSLIKAGFTRIGIARNYIHADDDLTKDAMVIWLY